MFTGDFNYSDASDYYCYILLRDPMFKGDSNSLYLAVFTWSLTMRMYQNPDIKTIKDPLLSPVLRGR